MTEQQLEYIDKIRQGMMLARVAALGLQATLEPDELAASMRLFTNFDRGSVSLLGSFELELNAVLEGKSWNRTSYVY